jgi:hypothetical protein
MLKGRPRVALHACSRAELKQYLLSTLSARGGKTSPVLYTYTEPERQLAQEALLPWRTPDPGPPGVSSRCTDVHAKTAGLHATAAMGLSGRLEFDSSTHGLC